MKVLKLIYCDDRRPKVLKTSLQSTIRITLLEQLRYSTKKTKIIKEVETLSCQINII